MDECFAEAVRLLSQGESFVLATLFNRHGSVPRTSGARMLLRQDGGSAGTIGGGLLEARVQAMAPDLFTHPGAQIRHFNLSGKDASQMEMICGGQVDVLVNTVTANDPANRAVFERLVDVLSTRKRAWLVTIFNETIRTRCLLELDGTLTPAGAFEVVMENGSPAALHGQPLSAPLAFPDLTAARQPLLLHQDDLHALLEPVSGTGTALLLGGGHISQKLAPFTNTVGFHTLVLDDRPEFTDPARFPEGVEALQIESFAHALDQVAVDEDTYVVIVTRGHLHDAVVLAQALRTPAGYIGMIGSKRKTQAVYDELAQQGFTPADFARVHAPIGLSIDAETPEEIAVSIVAEMIQIRAKRGR